MLNELRKKTVQTYVLRTGRITPAQKKALFSEQFEYGLSLSAGLINTNEIFGRKGLTVLEIGFGMGDSLAEMANNHRDENYIGIEVHPPGIGNLIKLVDSWSLTNVRIYWADALDVISDCLPTYSLDRVQVYFPDPWHKKKHHKRRLVTKDFLSKIADKLKSGGIFHFVTDWKPYAECVMDLVDGNSRFINLAGKSNYSERPNYRPVTKFEKRGERLGHEIWEIILEKSFKD